jgi:alpha-ketoglutarate-dependent taurine dioxygenase
MDAATTTRLEVVPLTKHIGAEIRGVDLRDDLDGETVKAIREAWLDHLVLVFRGQQFGQEELVRATGYFGEIGPLSRPPKLFPKGFTQHHDDFQHPGKRRDHRGITGRRNEFPSRHDPP